MMWRDIATAPKQPDAVLLAHSGGVTVGGWLSDVDHGADYEGQIGMAGWWMLEGEHPTHWMPLPPPPAMGTHRRAEVTTVEDFCGVMQEVDTRETDHGTEYRVNKWTCPRCGKACSNIDIDDEWCHGDSLCISFIDGVKSIRCGACWRAPTGEKPVSEPTKPFVVSWEYMDGSGGWHDFDTHEAAYDYARPFFGDPMRIWINDEVIHRGFRASDEQE
jgi:hypothetical protein